MTNQICTQKLLFGKTFDKDQIYLDVIQNVMITSSWSECQEL